MKRNNSVQDILSLDTIEFIRENIASALQLVLEGEDGDSLELIGVVVKDYAITYSMSIANDDGTKKFFQVALRFRSSMTYQAKDYVQLSVFSENIPRLADFVSTMRFTEKTKISKAKAKSIQSFVVENVQQTVKLALSQLSTDKWKDNSFKLAKDVAKNLVEDVEALNDFDLVERSYAPYSTVAVYDKKIKVNPESGKVVRLDMEVSGETKNHLPTVKVNSSVTVAPENVARVAELLLELESLAINDTRKLES